MVYRSRMFASAITRTIKTTMPWGVGAGARVS